MMTTTTTIIKLLTLSQALFQRSLHNIPKGGQRHMAKVVMNAVPAVHITREAFHRLRRYITLCPTEIAGLGKMRRIGNDVEIYEIFTLPQVATAGSAVIEPEAIANYLTRMAETEEPTEHLSVWWHSHADFGCHWSGVDMKMSDSFSTDFMVGILGNRQYQFTCRVDIYQPFRLEIVDLPLVCPEIEVIDEEIRAEINAHVRHNHVFTRL